MQQRLDNALRLLPATGSRGSHGLLQDQYLRERNLIIDGIGEAERAAAEQKRWDAQEATNQELRRLVRPPLSMLAQQAGLFAVIALILVRELRKVSASASLHDRLWQEVQLGGSLLVVAVAAGGIAALDRRRRKPR